ncbi:MAG: DNA-binding protein [Spirochaetae bacterium HGW-Spirochaetae-5]|nr:MAG: DNA-binding protein [Spirochaetae bacterium HGW-Spirochaetae-5]
MNSINTDTAAMNRIADILDKKRDMIKLSLSACVHCSICSESCFKFNSNKKDPTYTPAYKVINSIGRIYKKKGKLSDSEYDKIKILIWDKCVLCMRCYCPLGISIPSLIACARSVCREKGFYRTYDETADGPEI